MTEKILIATEKGKFNAEMTLSFLETNGIPATLVQAQVFKRNIPSKDLDFHIYVSADDADEAEHLLEERKRR